MKKEYNNILDAFKSVFGCNVRLSNTFEDLNPYSQISVVDNNYDSIIPGHVQEFLKQKKQYKKDRK
tara:strand:- start:1344 stop:1541 length:198 start_codon:yes stop_codon:yes gene_type:complete